MKIIASVAQSKGKCCTVLMTNGYIIKKEYNTFSASNSYIDTINALKYGLLAIRSYINISNFRDDTFIIECSNSQVIKWVDELYAKEQYQEEFDELLHLLNSLPIQYKFSYAKTPVAMRYLKNNGDIKKMKLSSLMD